MFRPKSYSSAGTGHGSAFVGTSKRVPFFVCEIKCFSLEADASAHGFKCVFRVDFRCSAFEEFI